jgi:hypothetical protein
VLWGVGDPVGDLGRVSRAGSQFPAGDGGGLGDHLAEPEGLGAGQLVARRGVPVLGEHRRRNLGDVAKMHWGHGGRRRPQQRDLLHPGPQHSDDGLGVDRRLQDRPRNPRAADRVLSGGLAHVVRHPRGVGVQHRVQHDPAHPRLHGRGRGGVDEPVLTSS